MKRILLFPASIAQREAFFEAKKMGLHIVTVDGNPDAPCFSLANESYALNPGDLDKFLPFVDEYHKKNKIDGVLIVGCDLPVSMAKAAKITKSASICAEAAELTVNKIAMKKVLAQNGILVPDFFEIKSPDEIKDRINEGYSHLVLKPNDNSGARGVLQITPTSDIQKAFEFSRKHIKKKGLILEKFEPGLQISIEALVKDGIVYVTGFADRNYEFIDKYFPNIIENGATMPTILNSEQKEEVITVFARAIKALGINNNVAKGDMIYGENGAIVIEIAGRISGGKFASKLVPESNGVNLLEAAITLAVGNELNVDKLKPTQNRGVAVRYFFPEPGKLIEIEGVEKAKSMDGVIELITTYKPGDIIPAIRSHADRGGWVVCSAATREQAVNIAERAVIMVKFISNNVF